MSEVPVRLCTACNRPLEEGTAPAACLRCQNLYHPECWERLSWCLAFGCPSSPAEPLAQAQKPAAARTCPGCREENPPEAEICLSCGTTLMEKPPREVFVSAQGWRAESLEELIEQSERHWEQSVHHLYCGDFEVWLRDRGHRDLAEAARQARRTHTQHSVGLEAFLESTGRVPPPEVQVHPPELELTGPGPLVTAQAEIVNPGRGYLWGRVSCPQTGLQVEPEEFAGNRTRVTVTADLEALGEAGTESRLVVEAGGQRLEVPLRVRRVGLSTAVDFFRSGDTGQARAICRKLLEAHSGDADAWTLLAATYLQEDNETLAHQALRNLSGSCREVPSEIVECLFRWLEKGGGSVPGIDRSQLYQALLPCAGESLAPELKKALAAACLAKAQAIIGAAEGGGIPLWGSGSAAAREAGELLEVAQMCDPDLQEAARLKQRLASGTARRRMGRSAMVLTGLLAVAVAAFAVWARSTEDARALYGQGVEAMEQRRYRDAIRAFEALREEHPRYRESHRKLTLAYCQWGRQEIEEGRIAEGWKHLRAGMDQAVGNPELSRLVAGFFTDWAAELEARGELGLARIRLEEALKIDPANQAARAGVQRLSGETELYWAAHQLVTGPLGSQPLDYHQMASLQEPMQRLVAAGMKTYDTRMMVAATDLTGDGGMELVVAGTQGGVGREAQGGYAVYRVGPRRLEKVFEGWSRKLPILADLETYPLGGGGGAQAVVHWLGSAESAQQSLVIYYDGRRFAREEAPGDLRVSVEDANQDGRFEVMIPEVVADSTGEAHRVLLYRPFQWTAPGFRPSDADFSDYYRGYIETLREQIAHNPFPKGDPYHDLYNQDRYRAIAIAERLIR